MIPQFEFCNLQPEILVVDDDLFVLESISTLLSEYNYSTVACDNAGCAVDQLQRSKFDVVLTDINMPGVTGLEFLDRVRVEYPEIPVILMTGYAELDSAIDAIKKGAFDFLVKPASPNYLIHAVGKAVGHRRLIQMEKSYKEMLNAFVEIAPHFDEIFMANED